MDNLIGILKELCEADNVCGVTEALDIAERYLKPYCSVSRNGQSLIATMGGEGKTVLIEAHIDEIGMLVTDVKDGFLAVSPAGGIDARMLPGMRVNIHGKERLCGVFSSVPPHLRKDGAEAPSFDNLYIDTGLGSVAEQYVTVGDRVTFSAPFTPLCGNIVTSKALDDRAGVAALIKCAQGLSGQALKNKVVILLSDQEETTGSGAKTGGFKIDPDIAVAVDVSFGDQPGVSGHECGKLGDGAMIGISPLLSKEVFDGLKRVAEENGIKYQVEVMGGKTSTDADHIALTKEGVKTGLLSIPLRNMHTPVETVDMTDIMSVADILACFIKELENEN